MHSDVKPFLQSNSRIYSATKGLDEKTGQLLHEVIEDVLGVAYPYAVLSGPSFAQACCHRRRVASALNVAQASTCSRQRVQSGMI